MPRVCTICSHNERAEIDRALVGGEPFRNIAKRFGTSTGALTRHKSEHLPAHVAQAKEAAEVVEAGTLLEQLQALRQRAMTLLDKAEKAGDYRTALTGIREARACIETLLEVEGELDRRGVTNIVISAEWLELRTVILAALAPHPEARRAVAERLSVLEGGKSHADA